MAETAKKTVEAFDPWKTPKETWVYVTIPEEDATGLKHPPIGLNKIEFRAGETYHLPKAIAAFVAERVKVYAKSVVRLFSPQVDRVALREVAVGTTAPMTPSGDRPGFVDASTISTQ